MAPTWLRLGSKRLGRLPRAGTLGTIVMMIMTVTAYIRWDGWDGRVGKLGMEYHSPRIGRAAVLSTSMAVFRQL